MTAPRFDVVVHAPLRLQICAMLAAVDSAEFSAIRDELGVSDSVLSKHVKVLDEAGYLRVRKAVVASRQRTWLALTAGGRRALAGHVAELQRLLAPATEAVLDH
ncbi:MAG: transcriptional regulator [Cryobacterium sp.]|nr:transcriptional regulator [Cryobacterium sp.]